MNAIDLTTTSKVAAWLNPLTLTAQERVVLEMCITAASAYWLWAIGAGASDVIPAHSPLVEEVAFDERYDGNGNTRLFLVNRPIRSVTGLTVGAQSIAASNGQTTGYMIDQSKKSLSLIGSVGWPGSRSSQYASRGSGQRFWAGTQNVRVQYTAGYPTVAITDEIDKIAGGAGPYVANTMETWLSDTGVRFFSDGTPLVKVLVAPDPGEYYVMGGGAYLFNIADAGKQVMISYVTGGTPPDITLAATQMVGVNYKRRGWIDQASQAMANGAGTISFRDWELPPEVRAVIGNYKRQALVG